MRLTTLVSALTTLFACFIVFAGYASAQSVDALGPALCGSASHQVSATYADRDVDLASCERTCRRRFGYELFADGYEFVQGQGYWAYAQCIADCNNNFWKEFDRKTRGMSGER